MCIFCKIIKGEIPADIVYQDEDIIVIKDIAPAAPIHVLVIPKEHVANIMDLTPTMAAAVLAKIKLIAKQLGLDEKGFRAVINTGKDGGQTVDHLHIHVLGGRELAWPAG